MARSIVSGLKGGGPPAIYKYYGQKMCEQRLALSTPMPEKIVVIPAPGKARQCRDHAEQLAYSVAKITGAKYLPILVRSRDGEQKKKNERERRSAGPNIFINKESAAAEEALGDSKIVFIDDIITTGLTAHSAFLALGRPTDFEIWTLFNRIRLRGSAALATMHSI